MKSLPDASSSQPSPTPAAQYLLDTTAFAAGEDDNVVVATPATVEPKMRKASRLLAASKQ